MLTTSYSEEKSLIDVFNRAAGIPDKPRWFAENHLDALLKQPDEDRLISTAERIWPYVDWMPEEMTERNRAAWYSAVIRQRSTCVGWLLDHKVHRKH